MQLSLFDNQANNSYSEISLSDVFEAYFRCRKNKRNTANALAFEVDYERNLVGLWKRINDGAYTPNRSIAFVNRPVKRETFAADFRDRIVYHLIINKLNHLPVFSILICRFYKDLNFCMIRL